MEFIKADEGGIKTTKEILLNGGIVAHATETCYGFTCDMSNQNSIERLFKLKKRPFDSPVSALFNSVSDSTKYVLWSSDALAIANKHLPGPVTIILPIVDDFINKIFPTPHGGTTLGIRVSPYVVALNLTDKIGIPLCTTSANIHGQPNTYSPEEIKAQFTNNNDVPDIILDSGKLEPNMASTVIDMSGNNMETLREGKISI